MLLLALALGASFVAGLVAGVLVRPHRLQLPAAPKPTACTDSQFCKAFGSPHCLDGRCRAHCRSSIGCRCEERPR